MPADDTTSSTPDWIWPPRTVRETDFTDLFLSKDQVEMRGVSKDLKGAPVLRLVPPGMLTDLEQLREAIFQHAAREEFLLDYDGMRFRVTRIDDVNKIWFNLRRARTPVPDLADLNLGTQALLETIIGCGAPNREGLVVISGAMGHGKTTTACSVLKGWLETYGDVAVTVEDPPELVMTGRYGKGGRCYQTQAPNGDFGAAMRLTVRRSPRYIFLGEIRGPVEASTAIRAAVNGQVVITTIHANDPIGAIYALLKMVGGQEDAEMTRDILSTGLLAVLHQKLRRVRRQDGYYLTPEIHPLFTGPSKRAIQSMIRSGKLEQLVTEIAAQTALLSLGKHPVTGARTTQDISDIF